MYYLCGMYEKLLCAAVCCHKVAFGSSILTTFLHLVDHKSFSGQKLPQKLVTINFLVNILCWMHCIAIDLQYNFRKSKEIMQTEEFVAKYPKQGQEMQIIFQPNILLLCQSELSTLFPYLYLGIQPNINWIIETMRP